MDKVLRFSIPIPPSTNHAYFYAHGKRIRTADTKKYDANVRELAIQAMKDNNMTIFPLGEKIRMNMTYHFPDARIRDTHNSFKIPLDALEGVVYPNDYWVLINIPDFDIDKQNPRVDLEIYIERK